MKLCKVEMPQEALTYVYPKALSCKLHNKCGGKKRRRKSKQPK